MKHEVRLRGKISGISLISALVVAVAFLAAPMEGIPQTAEQLLDEINKLPEPRRTERLIEGAKKEGTLVWYTVTGIDTSRQTAEKFMAKYPFVKVEVLRLGTAAMGEKILTEFLANTYNADVMNTESQVAAEIAKRGWVARYRSPSYAGFKKLKGAIDPNYYWGVFYLSDYGVMGWNTNLVKDKPPKTLQDLLDPRWKDGKIVLERDFGPWLQHLIYSKFFPTEAVALDFLRKLAQQKPLLRDGHTSRHNMVVSGEAWINPQDPPSKCAEDIAAGGPLNCVSYTPVLESVIMSISFKPKHPYASALWVDYIFSAELQNWLASDQCESPRLAPHDDVTNFSARNKLSYDARDKWVVMPPDLIAKDSEKYRNLYLETFGVKTKK